MQTPIQPLFKNYNPNENLNLISSVEIGTCHTSNETDNSLLGLEIQDETYKASAAASASCRRRLFRAILASRSSSDSFFWLSTPSVSASSHDPSSRPRLALFLDILQ
ncbi:hypothetical protein KC19_VG053500 [Ceratodon purpureus]|uniref:Uncharacterized protein n=1 Tax=Ceratodon purpureus TaxID=3225 RepID=A0A8T0HM75_CERPU|nr:hypothetical protein KC19_VG053500 [Ceratodon purpureus]